MAKKTNAPKQMTALRLSPRSRAALKAIAKAANDSAELETIKGKFRGGPRDFGMTDAIEMAGPYLARLIAQRKLTIERLYESASS